MTATNAYGMKVVSLKYRVVFDFGGAYEGKGHYLDGTGTIKQLQ